VPESSLEQFEDFVVRCREAVRQQVRGRTEPFQTLWSQADDVVLMGAAGSHSVGWKEVSARLTWASERLDFDKAWRVESLLMSVNGDLGFTCDLEHMRREVNGEMQERTLRASQGYRFEDGGWRVVFRHGDPMAESVVPPELETK